MHHKFLAAILSLWAAASSAAKVFDWSNITDLTVIKWAQGVNSVSDLQEVLKDNCGIIEADVSYGTTFFDTFGDRQAVMSHDPFNSPASDNLKKWLTVFLSKNILKKGIKLDFKDSLAVPGSVAILTQNTAQLAEFPIYLHAEVLPAIVDGRFNFFKNWTFVSEMKKLPFEFYYSLGWTSYWDKSIKVEEFGYTWTDIFRMYKILEFEDLLPHPRLVFTARAVYCSPKSLDSIFWLMSKTNNSKLSIWSHVHEETFALPILNNLLQIVPRNRMLFDIPRIFSRVINYNSTASHCLRMSASGPCYGNQFEFNGTISPVVLLNSKETLSIKIDSFADFDLYTLKGSIETLNGQKSTHSITLSTDQNEETLKFEVQTGVTGTARLSSGANHAKSSMLCPNCINPAYDFKLQINFANKAASVRIESVSGSGEGKFKENLANGPVEVLSVKIQTGFLRNSNIVFRTNKNPVVYHNLVGNRLRDPSAHIASDSSVLQIFIFVPVLSFIIRFLI